MPIAMVIAGESSQCDRSRIGLCKRLQRIASFCGALPTRDYIPGPRNIGTLKSPWRHAG